MEPRFAPAREPQARAVWEAVLQPVFRELRAEVEPLSLAIVTGIREAYPDLFSDPGSFEDNLRATEANVALMADVVAGGLDPAEITLPPAAGAFARASVERGMPVGGALRSLRLGHALAWERLLPRLHERAADADDLERAVGLAGRWTFGFIDAVSVLAERVYDAEQQQWLRSASALRAEVIGALLAGEPVDAATASRQLGYDLARPHLAVVAWADDRDRDRPPLALLEDTVVRAAQAGGAGRPLLQPHGTHVVAGWLGLEAGATAVDPDALRTAVRGPEGIRMACGAVASGVAGFRESHAQAMLARRVALLSERPAGTLTTFPRVALASLATADLDQARAFVRSALGPLEPTDDTTRRLAATVKVFLEEDSSSSRAARRLGIHENTVRYRLRQAESLLGETISARSLDLRVALEIAGAALGDPGEA